MPTPRPIQAKRVLPLLLPLTMAACDSSPAAPTGGVMAIAVHTGGSSLDADGYVVRVGSRERIPVQISGAEEVSVEAGDYLVEVTEVAANCSVLGTNPRIMAVADGGTAWTDFDVECGYVPRDLVFVSDRGGDEDIYALGTDGSYPVRLTTDPADDSRPTWSPGGERIAFMRDGALFVMDAGGADPRALQGGNDQPSVREFEWSPDGTRLAYTKAGDGGWFGEEGSTTVWITDVDGGDPVELAEGYGATWSPDGTRLAFTSQAPGPGYEDLHVINADGSNLVALTDYDAADPAWSPDGTRILFTARARRGVDEHLEVVDVSGSGLVSMADYRVMDAAWSPDGTRIAFTAARDGNSDVYVVGADGSGLVRLTTHPAYDHQPVWSPDGTSIAFTSRRDDNSEIYLVEAEGSDPVNLTNDPARDRAPAWATQVAATSVDGLRG
jgi:Tol biopolymer transport system component